MSENQHMITGVGILNVNKIIMISLVDRAENGPRWYIHRPEHGYILTLLGGPPVIANKNLPHSRIMRGGQMIALFLQVPPCIPFATPPIGAFDYVLTLNERNQVFFVGPYHKDSQGADSCFRQDACFQQAY